MAGCYSRAMQRLFARRPPAPARLDVRPATLADRGALARLTEHSRRTHFHLDWWSIDDWLAEASSNAWVAVAGNPIAGTMTAGHARRAVCRCAPAAARSRD